MRADSDMKIQGRGDHEYTHANEQQQYDPDVSIHGCPGIDARPKPYPYYNRWGADREILQYKGIGQPREPVCAGNKEPGKKKEAGEGGLNSIFGPSSQHGIDNYWRSAGTEGRTYGPSGKAGHIRTKGWHFYCFWLESEAE